MLRRTALVTSLALGAALPGAGAVALRTAPPAAAADEDPVKEAEALVRLATPEVRGGNWEAARLHLGKARKADPSNAAAVLLLARVAEKTGDLRGALEMVSGLPPSVASLTRRTHLLLGTGDAAGAEKAAREALALDESALPARRLLGAALEETGRRDEAVEQYAEVNSRWARNDRDDSEDTDEDLLAVARARLGVLRLSDEIKSPLEGVVRRLETLLKRKEPPEEVYLEAAELYLLGQSDAEAKKWFSKAAEVNPRSADAIFGLARQMAFRYDDIGAQKECERALKENPQHVPSLLFLAEIALGDSSYEKAGERISAALAVNPEHAGARGARAALAFLRGDRAAFDAEVKAILARNPHASAAFMVLARALEEQRRFQEALEFAERGAETDPRDWDALFVAGRNAMNVGDDARAEKHLRASEKGDPFRNVYRHNFLEVFDALAKFPSIDAGRFRVKLPREIEKAYGPLVVEATEDALRELEDRWGFRAETPLFLSIFDRQDDFAARTIGLPGFPALGACFGRVVTLDSPRALPPGAFGWRLTLHHELAHVITLQLSKGRVPRWLTEGASVYEERKVSKTWNREAERDLIDAIASEDVLTLENVNNAFRGARVMYAYYQGGLMCEFVERDFGFPKLREMVRLYGEELDTPAVVRKALGIEPAEFDRRFLAWAKEYVSAYRVVPRPTREFTAKLAVRLRREKDDADGWRRLAEGQFAKGDVAGALQSIGKLAALRPADGRAATLRALIAFGQGRTDQAAQFAKDALAAGDDTFDLRMALAEDAIRAKDFAAAKEHFAKANEAFPVAPGGASPRLALVKLLLGEGEKGLAEAMRLLQEHCEIAEDDFQGRRRLADHYRDTSRPDDEFRVLREMLDVVPLPNGPWTREMCAELHERLAKHAADRKHWKAAEQRAAAAAEVAAMDLGREMPLDDGRRAELLALHAEMLHLLGRTDDARRRAEEALRLDGANERAGVLLEKLQR